MKFVVFLETIRIYDRFIRIICHIEKNDWMSFGFEHLSSNIRRGEARRHLGIQSSITNSSCNRGTKGFIKFTRIIKQQSSKSPNLKMVRPSNPRLMARVLDAVANLGDTKGSSAREVLSFIRHSNVSFKNLTLQVQRALKHAVNAGLLRHRSGRYKTLATLNPNTVPNPSANKESANNDQKNKEKKSKSDVQAPVGDMESLRRTQERKRKRTTSRRRNSRRRSKRRQRKRTHEDEEFEDQSSEQDFLHGRDDSSVPFNRRTKRSRLSKRELESDFSDESDCDSDMSRKRVSRANKLYREPRHKKTRAKSKGKSVSRTPSQQLQRAMQERQHPIEETGNDRQRCDEDQGSTERNIARQEAHKDVERVREPNDSNSGSTLENSRD
ncbi:PREDICTED: U1 small nuclear ribonucleoprotein 70 kDa isoform X1 [Wasmannia auropunctata]|uniref:U1 small nuclear ribonucleoprotein 70 kDa isoform X1 n=1 Tax=Wasmannia auropunctata TaxID=64793 RepID=UPI0005EF0E52|nr:PREDICTED: U1 small nuclear ribonucleoprotein 70 kDa isoform X1 [Wasmannia auropunctata]